MAACLGFLWKDFRKIQHEPQQSHVCKKHQKQGVGAQGITKAEQMVLAILMESSDLTPTCNPIPAEMPCPSSPHPKANQFSFSHMCFLTATPASLG